ncbi:MAG TPA: sensor domain-containing diguanylate cyclase, partial [Longimicrobiales bacterium]|nr:sensor domain-containing diguanylate cyclase [Longimicrobiales bacterium]
YAFFFIGLVTAVHLNERGRLTELLLDVGLVVTAAALVMVRWAPGAYVVTTGASTPTILLVVFGPVVGLSSLLLGSVLFTTPAPTVSRNALIGIIFAITALLFSTLPQIMNGGSCCHAGSYSVVGAIGLWLGLVYAAAGELGAGEQLISSAAGERLRSFVAPTVAIVLATISIEGAVNPPLGPRTAFALGVLGALVALRLTELLNATRMQVAERRELAQTRALVEVSRALAGKNDLDATLRIVTQWAVRVLNARAATVELLSSDARNLELRAVEGLPETTIGMTFPVENSFTGWVIMNGEARVTTDPRRDPFISEASLVYLGDSPVAAMPLRYRERLLGVLTCIGTRPFEGEDLDLLRAFANQTAVALEDARLFDQVRALSVTDPLTGLANRRQLDRELTREFAAAQRGRRLVAVMFDLDDFKQHNDKYGHVAGDEALKLFADALSTTTRTMNLASRYGGDEFFALLADADLNGAEIFIQRARDRFHRSMDAAGWPVLKVSAGMAEYTTDMKTPEELVQAADRALYVAKFEADVSA